MFRDGLSVCLETQVIRKKTYCTHNLISLTNTSRLCYMLCMNYYSSSRLRVGLPGSSFFALSATHIRRHFFLEVFWDVIATIWTSINFGGDVTIDIELSEHLSLRCYKIGSWPRPIPSCGLIKINKY